MINAVYIAGTDTGVGKTLVTAALCHLLHDRGLSVMPMKPVETGCTPERVASGDTDLDFCLGCIDTGHDAGTYAAMSPYRFKMPASPHLAAAKEGKSIETRRIRGALDHLCSAHDCIVVEGAGGLHVPLNEQETNLDLIKTLRIPVVLVARAGLGTINHTLLSCEALQTREIPVLGLVFSHSERDACAEIAEDNRATIRARSGIATIGTLPWMATPARELVATAQDLDTIAMAVVHAICPGKI